MKGEADAVFGSRMMPEHGGPLKGGMPLYKFVGNRILTYIENYALGLDLSEFHSGYRAYSLDVLRRIDMTRMTDDFHFDTQIIIKLNHQGFRIKEVPIPTYYGNEICYVNGMKYAWDVFTSVVHYKRTVRALERYPEYSEYFVHYPMKESNYSSYYYFKRWVGQNQCVLDLGCGEGFFAKKLAEDNNVVVGVDMLPDPKCRESLQKYLCSDLSNGLDKCVADLSGKTFDRILLQDILEHVGNPAQLLSDCNHLLKPHGRLLVSVPNVANISVRLSLLFGKFEYSERGILDRTHLRFYTRKTARKLLAETGYQVLSTVMTVMPVELALGLPAGSGVMRAATRILAFFTSVFPGLLGYQILLLARSDAPEKP
ncbi:MAG: methyltransferase domain-containing protein [Nitrospirae bacterium]|nr:methyltransferase domain-containing protein [Nitrospirota bacterium]